MPLQQRNYQPATVALALALMALPGSENDATAWMDTLVMWQQREPDRDDLQQYWRANGLGRLDSDAR